MKKNNLFATVEEHKELFAFDNIQTLKEQNRTNQLKISNEGLISDIFSFIFGKKKDSDTKDEDKAEEIELDYKRFDELLNNNKLKDQFEVKSPTTIAKKYANSFSDDSRPLELSVALSKIDNRLTKIQSLFKNVKQKYLAVQKASNDFTRDYEKLDYQNCTYEDLKKVIQKHMNNPLFKVDLSNNYIPELGNYKNNAKEMQVNTNMDLIEKAIGIYKKHQNFSIEVLIFTGDMNYPGIDLTDPPFRGFIDEIDEDRPISDFLNSIYVDEMSDRVTDIFRDMDDQVGQDMNALMYLVLKSIQ